MSTARPHDPLAFWSEKFPLGLALAAQSLVVTRWYLGHDAPDPVVFTVLAWLTVLVALAAGIAFDLMVVTTVMARRAGRRSAWGVATALAAAIASALIALDVYGGWTPGPYLHAAYPVVIFLFCMHLSAPRTTEAGAQREAERRALVRRLARALRSSRGDAAQQTSALAQLEQTAAHHDSQAAQAVAQARSEAAQLRAELAQAQAHLRSQTAQLAQVRAEAAQDATIGGVSLRRAAQALELPESTLRSKLKAQRQNGHASVEVE